MTVSTAWTMARSHDEHEQRQEAAGDPEDADREVEVVERADRGNAEHVHEQRERPLVARARSARATRPGASRTEVRTSGIDDATVTHAAAEAREDRRHRRRARHTRAQDRVEQPSSARRLGPLGSMPSGLSIAAGALLVLVGHGRPRHHHPARSSVVDLVVFVVFFVVAVVEVASRGRIVTRSGTPGPSGPRGTRPAEQDDARDHQRRRGRRRRGAGPGSASWARPRGRAPRRRRATNATRPAPRAGANRDHAITGDGERPERRSRRRRRATPGRRPRPRGRPASRRSCRPARGRRRRSARCAGRLRSARTPTSAVPVAGSRR